MRECGVHARPALVRWHHGYTRAGVSVYMSNIMAVRGIAVNKGSASNAVDKVGGADEMTAQVFLPTTRSLVNACFPHAIKCVLCAQKVGSCGLCVIVRPLSRITFNFVHV